MAKRIYVKMVDFVDYEVVTLNNLGYKFDSKGYLLLDGNKVKLDLLEGFKEMLSTYKPEEEVVEKVEAQVIEPVDEYSSILDYLSTPEEEFVVHEELEDEKMSSGIQKEMNFVLPPELIDDEEYYEVSEEEATKIETELMAEKLARNNEIKEGGTAMLQEREIAFDDLEVKALRNLGFKVTQEGIFFNDMEVNYEQKQKMKKELRIMTKYTKVYHSSDIDPSNFNKYSAFVWVSILRRETGISHKKLTDIIKGITMSQYIHIPSGKLVKLKEAIETSNLNADWKNRLVRSINAQ